MSLLSVDGPCARQTRYPVKLVCRPRNQNASEGPYAINASRFGVSVWMWTVGVEPMPVRWD